MPASKKTSQNKTSSRDISKNKLNARMCNNPIAIVGMSALFPEAKNLNQYWDNIVSKMDSIIDVPESRWKIEDFYDMDADAPDKTYCKRGGFIPDIDFNPIEFGIPPNILEVTDVTQLLGLMVAKSAMEDAGYSDASDKILDKTGVILGVTAGMKLLGSLTSRLQYPIWEKVLIRSGISENDTNKIIEKMKKAYVRWEENSFPGLLGNVIAGRIANRLNLGGTNCTVDAACASSLSAMKMAVSDLLEYRSDMMITGGVDADNSPMMYMCFSKTPAFTKGENPRPFDENSGGVMIGEGMGMVILKRLEDAKHDGDNIYAIIKGIGTSSDGRFKSIYAPRSGGQAKALRRAYEDANIDPMSIGLLEAHGTGTAAGDLAEFEGLKEVFAKNNLLESDSIDSQYIALGSIKSQIGHTKAAAGIAGLIKTVLALHHKILPPTINIEQPNTKLGIEKTPFYLNTETRPWITNGYPRRAGVSAFGFGGTNFHFVLEEFNDSKSVEFRMQKTFNNIFLSGTTFEELIVTCKNLIEELNQEGADHLHRKLVESSLGNTIPKNHARLGFVTESIENTLELLKQSVTNLEINKEKKEWITKGVVFRSCAMETEGKVVALFSGQGSQYLNMGKDLILNFPEMAKPFTVFDKIFKDKSEETVIEKKSLSKLIFPIKVFDEEKLSAQEIEIQLTEIAQPAIGAISTGLFTILKNAGLKADFSAGHSFGELTALWAAGVISEEDFYKLAYARGQAMAAPKDKDFDAGSMLAVMGKVKNLEDEIVDFPEIVMANLNSNKQVVLAGPTKSIMKVHDFLKEKKYTVVKLQVSAAFHTPLVGHAQKPFAKAIRSVNFKKPKIPVYSNATSKAYSTLPKKIQKQLESHILNSVRFREEIENIYDDGGRIFIEFGPKNVLTKLVDNVLSGKEYQSIALNENPKKNSDHLLREALVKLCVLGLPLQKFDPYEKSLPKIQDKKSGVSISLNGANYVSDNTREDFENTLNDGFKVSSSKSSHSDSGSILASTSLENNSAGTIEEDSKYKGVNYYEMNTSHSKVESSEQKPTNNLNMSKQKPTSEKAFIPKNLTETLQKNLSSFYQHQNETLQVHQKYLDQQVEYSRTVFHFLEKQIELTSLGKQVPSEIDSQMRMFHAHQAETLKVHEKYLSQQSEQSQSALNITQMELGFSERNFDDSTSIQNTYIPKPVPELSIQKKLEVASVSERTNDPALPIEKVPDQVIPDNVPYAPTKNVSQIDLPQTSPESVLDVTMEVVSEKTGYPKEMIELNMDIESDLGIDSIKRVEILGSIQDKIPELLEIPADELGEMRTLGQIVDFLKDGFNEDVSDIKEKSHIQKNIQEKFISELSSVSTNSDLTEVMMTIVSEKTGYPQEMLDLSMDMESDLGIDSIKRVEILGSIQDQVPELPEVPGDELAEMRTLSQIVEYLKSKMGSVLSDEENLVSEDSKNHQSTSINSNDVGTEFISIVSEKTGYPSEMIEQNMDMEADLGIDSIKRVEIMWAIQEKFKELPQIEANDLAELRTIGQIIEHLEKILFNPSSKINHGASESIQTIIPENKISNSDTSGNGSAEVIEGFSSGDITSSLLNIINEKTGYPKEMLEMNMDIEADLGIDSIKRVEIMWALQEKLPHIPQAKGTEIGELRTLKEIVDHLDSLSPAESEDSSIITTNKSEFSNSVKKKS